MIQTKAFTKMWISPTSVRNRAADLVKIQLVSKDADILFKNL